MKPDVTILDALRNPDLFGRLARFRDLQSWQAWIAALKALFNLPMTDEEAALYMRCTGRLYSPTEEAAEAAFVVGRRGGKTQISAVLAVYLALLRDWQSYLGPGERVHVALIAQNTRAATRALFAYVQGVVRGVPVFAGEVTGERDGELDFRNRATISVWPSTYRSVRGLTLAAAILDEIDLYWQKDSPNAAAEVVAAVRPAMASLPGSKLIAVSSPYTPVGWLYEFHRRHWGQPGQHLVWQAPSRTMNPTLSAERIEAMMAEDPERLTAEFEATWRAGISALFDPTLVDACGRRSPLTLPRQQGIRYFGGCDPCGGGPDEFAWGLAHMEGERVIVDLVASRGRQGRRGFDVNAAVADCATDLAAYGLTETTGDKYAGAWVVEAFRKYGITYHHTDRTKSEIYLELLPLVTGGRVEWPEDGELMRQAKLLERRRGAQGKDSVDHPHGAHDDRLNAAALAVTRAVAERPFDINIAAATILGPRRASYRPLTADLPRHTSENVIPRIDWSKDTPWNL